jgi:hypothetical protein
MEPESGATTQRTPILFCFAVFFKSLSYKTGQEERVYCKIIERHSTVNVKSKTPTLLSCRPDHPLHFETNLDSLAFKMLEKFGKYGNFKKKSHTRERF